MAGVLKISTLNDDTGVLATQNGMTGVCKAWVNFNGVPSTPTITSSFNVGSITKNGTGDYTVNFTTAMPNANYCIVCLNTQSSGNAPGTISKNTNRTDTASLVNIACSQGATRFDSGLVSVAIFSS